MNWLDRLTVVEIIKRELKERENPVRTGIGLFLVYVSISLSPLLLTTNLTTNVLACLMLSLGSLTLIFKKYINEFSTTRKDTVLVAGEIFLLLPMIASLVFALKGFWVLFAVLLYPFIFVTLFIESLHRKSSGVFLGFSVATVFFIGVILFIFLAGGGFEPTNRPIWGRH